MEEKLNALREEVESEITTVGDEVTLQNLKARYVGRKGVLTEILKGMKDISDEERPKMGKLVNETKVFIEALFDNKFEALKEEKKREALSQEKIDVTLPARGRHPGCSSSCDAGNGRDNRYLSEDGFSGS